MIIKIKSKKFKLNDDGTISIKKIRQCQYLILNNYSLLIFLELI